jgi:hypothetical protein
MNAKSVDGNFDNGSVTNQGWNRDPDNLLLPDHALTVAFHTKEEPIPSRAAAPEAGMKHRNR